ncbi:protein of unknown function [Cardinium endosymbiont cEper1 of Encarsia pergandiella]|nr:protein of unknown function [Cardinium endosymbiont cEper1 of Encarsia pergandiella]
MAIMLLKKRMHETVYLNLPHAGRLSHGLDKLQQFIKIYLK